MQSKTVNLAAAFLGLYPAAVAGVDFVCTFTFDAPPPLEEGEVRTEQPEVTTGTYELEVTNPAMPFNLPEQQAAVLVDQHAALALKRELELEVQKHLDTTAQSIGYDNIYTACTYADEPAVAKFQTEGRALRAWRSLVWAHAAQVLADVQGGQRTTPTAEALIAELPVFNLP